jgi:hypothetical protein
MMSPKARLCSLLALLFVVFFPIVLSGMIKLAHQDLSAMLEGCGWAINHRMRLTRRLRRQFTERKRLPRK